STDETAALILQAKQEHQNIFLYQQKNQYAGIARNHGLEKAKGKYVIFLDPDDFFEPDLLEKACGHAIRYDAEITLFSADVYHHRENRFTSPKWLRFPSTLPKNRTFSPVEMGEKAVYSLNPWTKLYRRGFVLEKGLLYQGTYSSNDVHFAMMALAQSKRIIAFDEVLVHYRVNTGTSLQNTKSKHPKDIYDAFFLTKRELEKQQQFATFQLPFVNKGVEAMLGQIDTLKEMAAKKAFYSFMQQEGFEQLELDGYRIEDFTQEESQQRYRKYLYLRDLPWDDYQQILLSQKKEEEKSCKQRGKIDR
ncbi:MAG: glycosyltransferase family 2 protein, partial [Clostridiales bacterium]|nr:glycosyltransferase family 2 protein [Clostridiales bacterium]